MTKEEVRAYFARFEAIEEADRQQRLRQGPRPPAQTLRSMLSLVDFAAAFSETAPSRQARDAGAEQVRSTWARLRERLA